MLSRIWLGVAALSLYQCSSATAQPFDKASDNQLQWSTDSLPDITAAILTTPKYSREESELANATKITPSLGLKADDPTPSSQDHSDTATPTVYDSDKQAIDLSAVPLNVSVTAYHASGAAVELRCLSMQRSTIDLKKLAWSMQRINGQDGVVEGWNKQKQQLYYGVTLDVPEMTVVTTDASTTTPARQCAITRDNSTASYGTPHLISRELSRPITDAKTASHIVGKFVAWLRAVAVMHEGHLAYLPSITSKTPRRSISVPKVPRQLSKRDLRVIFTGVKSSAHALVMPRILYPRPLTEEALKQDIALVGSVAAHISALMTLDTTADQPAVYKMAHGLLASVISNCDTGMLILNQLNWLKLWLGRYSKV